MLTPLTNKLTRNVIGATSPCHNPAQNPAGLASGPLYFELAPATASEFAIMERYHRAENSRRLNAPTDHERFVIPSQPPAPPPQEVYSDSSPHSPSHQSSPSQSPANPPARSTPAQSSQKNAAPGRTRQKSQPDPPQSIHLPTRVSEPYFQ